MFRLAWTTDVHLNFCHLEKIKSFCDKLNAENLDALVITGDISEGDKLKGHLLFLEQHLHVPMFFVLGNHDFYNSGIGTVRDEMHKSFSNKLDVGSQLTENACYWLGTTPFIELTPDVALVGHDGMYDGQYANWFKSRITMCDWEVIAEFKPLHSNLLFEKINEIAQESADYVTDALPKAFKDHDHVILATHVPPWPQNSIYMGKISDDHWMPHFSSKKMGDAILDMMQNYPGKNLTVICGHSHGKAEFHPTSNIVSHTGHARYRHPALNKVFEF